MPSRTSAWRPRLPWPVSSAESLCVRRPILSARPGLRAATLGSRLASLRRSSGVRLAPPSWLPRGGHGVAAPSPSPSSSASEASSSASHSNSCWALSADDVSSIDEHAASHTKARPEATQGDAAAANVVTLRRARRPTRAARPAGQGQLRLGVVGSTAIARRGAAGCSEDSDLMAMLMVLEDNDCWRVYQRTVSGNFISTVPFPIYTTPDNLL